MRGQWYILKLMLAVIANDVAAADTEPYAGPIEETQRNCEIRSLPSLRLQSRNTRLTELKLKVA